VVAPGVRFNAFAIVVTPDFAFAIVFIVRTSSFVHARRTAFLALAIHSPNRNFAEAKLLHMTVWVGEQFQVMKKRQSKVRLVIWITSDDRRGIFHPAWTNSHLAIAEVSVGR
jgi:hypothetical protein